MTEADSTIGVSTSFIFDALENGIKTRLTISTDMQPPAGIAGFIQGLMTPLLLRRRYGAVIRCAA